MILSNILTFLLALIKTKSPSEQGKLPGGDKKRGIEGSHHGFHIPLSYF